MKIVNYSVTVCALLFLLTLLSCERLTEKVGPLLALNGDPYFGETWVGEKITRSFVLTNNGDEQASGLTLQLPAGYTSSKGTTLGNVAPKDSLVFDVTFAPTAAGIFNGDLLVKPTDNTTLNQALTGKAADKVWDKCYGGSSSENLRAMIATSDGGHLLVGSSLSPISGDKTQSSKGGPDYWVAKINANSDKVWDKTYGGDKEDYVMAALATPDGGFLLGGFSLSNQSGDKTQISKGDSDYWVVKITANGDKQWDKTFGGSSYESLNSIAATADGGYLLGGNSGSGVSGDKTQASKGSGGDFWVVKINGNGDKVWDKAFGGSGSEQLFNVLAVADGGFLLSGVSSSGISGDKSQGSKGLDDYWLVKINANGYKVWDKAYGGSDSEYNAKVIATADGGFLLGGTGFSGISGDKTQATKGYWVIKINASGDKVWDQSFGGNYAGNFADMLLTSDGGFLLGGTSFSDISGDKTQVSRGSEDYWIVKINANGDKVWDRTFGAKDEEYLYSLAATSDEGFLLGGNGGMSVSGDKTQPSKGGYDCWIVKIR